MLSVSECTGMLECYSVYYWNLLYLPSLKNGHVKAILFLSECTVKPVLSGHSNRSKNGFENRLSLNAGQKYEHSAILFTFIKLPFVIKILVLPICTLPSNWPSCLVIYLLLYCL